MICLPKESAIKLKQAARSGEVSVEKLYKMTSEERRKLFEKYVGKESGHFVNAGFEKAMVSSQKDALGKWVEKTFVGAKSQKKTMLDKINSISDLIDSKGDMVLDDLVMDKLGVSVKPNEVVQIKKLAEKVGELHTAIGEDVTVKFGNDTHNQNLVEFFQANRKLDDYVNSLNPRPQGKILLSTIGRGNMLMSPKSIILNIESNTINGALEFVTRRAENRIMGANSKAMVEYIKLVNKIYDQSGYDITRMIDPEVGAYQGEKVIRSVGKGWIRKAGQFYEDTIYKWGLGKPDVVASSFAFADSANLTSTVLAKRMKLKGEALKSKALDIFQDSTSPNPKTVEGMAVREQAMKDAMEATYTNNGMLSTAVLKTLREPLNKLYGGLGEFVIPFAKTPANVIEIGADYGGLGAVKALVKVARGFNEIRSGNTSIIKSAVRDAVRTGVGYTTAYLLTAWLNPDDYIGEYPTTAKEKALLDAKNATPNSVKIGDKYISLDYFGPLAAPMVGILRAKKFGKESAYLTNIKEYATGISQQFLRTPGLDEVRGIITGTYKAIKEPFTADLPQMVEDAINSLIDSIPPRVLPAIITDFTKMTDTTQRRQDYGKPLTRIQAKIPFWATELPEKKTIFGEVKKTEQWWSQLLFGARVKTAIDTPLMNELTRLDRSGQLPAIGSPEYSSTRFISLKSQIGDIKFRKAMDWYSKELNKKMSDEIKKTTYKKMTPDKQKSTLDNIKGDVMDSTLSEFGYKKPRT